MKTVQTFTNGDGYAVVNPNGSVEIQRQQHLQIGAGGVPFNRETSKVTLSKESAVELAKFILEIE